MKRSQKKQDFFNGLCLGFMLLFNGVAFVASVLTIYTYFGIAV